MTAGSGLCFYLLCAARPGYVQSLPIKPSSTHDSTIPAPWRTRPCVLTLVLTVQSLPCVWLPGESNSPLKMNGVCDAFCKSLMITTLQNSKLWCKLEKQHGICRGEKQKLAPYQEPRAGSSPSGAIQESQWNQFLVALEPWWTRKILYDAC